MMDYVFGETAWSLIKSRTKISSTVWDDVETAIDILLHEENLVFDNMRLPKIIRVPTESGDSMRAKHFDSN